MGNLKSMKTEQKRSKQSSDQKEQPTPDKLERLQTKITKIIVSEIAENKEAFTVYEINDVLLRLAHAYNSQGLKQQMDDQIRHVKRLKEKAIAEGKKKP